MATGPISAYNCAGSVYVRVGNHNLTYIALQECGVCPLPIPCVCLDCLLQVLEGMGQGPSGPPLPQPLTLQMYPYPLKRRKLEQTAHERFVFIGTSPDDP